MNKFSTLKSIPAYLPIVNIDTDMIIPKQFLKTIKRTGLGKNLPYKYSTFILSNPLTICKLSEEDKTFVLPSIFAWAIEQSKSSKMSFFSKLIEALNFSIKGSSALSNLLLQTFAISISNFKYL